MKLGPGDFCGSKLAVLEAPDHVMQRGGAEEIFLLQPELLALEHVVIRVEDPGDVLRQVTVQHRLDVVPGVEHLQVEALGALGGPEPQGVDHIVSEPGDGVVVREGQHHLRVDPLAAALGGEDDLAVEVDRHGELGSALFPGVAVPQPVVRLLKL